MNSDTLKETLSIHPGDADVLMGVKRITKENFSISDVSRLFGLDESGWIDWFSEVQLHSIVPEPVRRMFEVARGAMIYGWYYYPLLNAGSDECIRCLEAGARHAASVVNLHPEPDKQVKVRFHSIIRDLVQAGLIDENDLGQWDAGRALRNAAAHPTTPTLLAPGQARAMLKITAEKLNALFSRAAVVSQRT